MRRAHLVSVDIGADWVESGRAGENPQPEGKEKQAGWVESGGTRENPQPEGKMKQARWVESSIARDNPLHDAAQRGDRDVKRILPGGLFRRAGREQQGCQ